MGRDMLGLRGWEVGNEWQAEWDGLGSPPKPSHRGSVLADDLQPGFYMGYHGFGVFLNRSFYSPLFCNQNEPLVMPNRQVLTKLWSKKISAKCNL